MRFCMVTTFYPPYNFGGDGIFVHRLSNELARRGHAVDVIHCRDAYDLLARRGPTEGYENHPNVTVHGLRSRVGLLSPLASHQTGYALFKSAAVRAVLEKGHDVIHYHNMSLLGPKILEYGEGIKLYTMHEYWLVCPTHTLLRFKRAPCTERHCLACALTYKRPPQLWRHSGLLEDALAHVDVFLAPSRFSEHVHRRILPSAPIVHFPPFVPEIPNPQRFSAERSVEPYFLFVGRLERLKGLQTLIPVFIRHRRVQLRVAGTGSYEQQLRRLAGEDDVIRFLGVMSQLELQALYGRALAVIVPSICLEVFPLVILEAFRQETPAIVRNLGGMPEIIEASGGGVVYDTDAELTAVMDRLRTDAPYARQLGEHGHESWRRNWTAEVHLERYFALIGRIAAARAVRPA